MAREREKLLTDGEEQLIALFISSEEFTICQKLWKTEGRALAISAFSSAQSWEDLLEARGQARQLVRFPKQLREIAERYDARKRKEAAEKNK